MEEIRVQVFWFVSILHLLSFHFFPVSFFPFSLLFSSLLSHLTQHISSRLSLPCRQLSGHNQSIMVETSSIAALLKRLDAVTTKLEDQAMAGASAADVSSSLTGSGGVVGAGGPRPSQSLSVPPSGGNGSNSGGVSLGGSPSISGVPTTTSGVPAVVDGYDELVNGPLKVFIELSHAIGGLVEEQVTLSWHSSRSSLICLSRENTFLRLSPFR